MMILSTLSLFCVFRSCPNVIHHYFGRHHHYFVRVTPNLKTHLISPLPLSSWRRRRHHWIHQITFYESKLNNHYRINLFRHFFFKKKFVIHCCSYISHSSVVFFFHFFSSMFLINKRAKKIQTHKLMKTCSIFSIYPHE